MRHRVAIVIALLFGATIGVMLLTGCGGDDNTSPDESSQRAVVGPIDLARYDPDNVIGDAEACVIDVLAGVEGLDAGSAGSNDYGPIVFQAARECDVDAAMAFNNRSGKTVLAEP